MPIETDRDNPNSKFLCCDKCSLWMADLSFISVAGLGSALCEKCASEEGSRKDSPPPTVESLQEELIVLKSLLYNFFDSSGLRGQSDEGDGLMHVFPCNSEQSEGCYLEQLVAGVAPPVLEQPVEDVVGYREVPADSPCDCDSLCPKCSLEEIPPNIKIPPEKSPEAEIPFAELKSLVLNLLGQLKVNQDYDKSKFSVYNYKHMIYCRYGNCEINNLIKKVQGLRE